MSNPGRHCRKGRRVLINETENVMQRVPHLIGKKGTIIEMPVHPATWIKVEFPNGMIATFRPSALHVLSNDDSEYESEDSICIESSNESIIYKNSAHSKSLATVDPEKWSQQKVRVKSGRHTGVLGRVVSAGNGWVQIAIDGGEISKRAHDLEILPETEPINSISSASLVSTPSQRRKRPSNSSRCLSKVQRTTLSSYKNQQQSAYHSKLNHSTIKSLSMEEARAKHRKTYFQMKLKQLLNGNDSTSLELYHRWLLLSKELHINDQLNEAIVSTDNTTKKNNNFEDFKDLEDEILRSFITSHCPVCYMEMWSGCTYCCNENCSQSPLQLDQGEGISYEEGYEEDHLGIFTKEEQDNFQHQSMKFAADILLAMREATVDEIISDVKSLEKVNEELESEGNLASGTKFCDDVNLTIRNSTVSTGLDGTVLLPLEASVKQEFLAMVPCHILAPPTASSTSATTTSLLLYEPLIAAAPGTAHALGRSVRSDSICTDNTEDSLENLSCWSTSTSTATSTSTTGTLFTTPQTCHLSNMSISCYPGALKEDISTDLLPNFPLLPPPMFPASYHSNFQQRSN